MPESSIVWHFLSQFVMYKWLSHFMCNMTLKWLYLRNGAAAFTTKEAGKHYKQQLITFEYQRHKSSFQLLFEDFFIYTSTIDNEKKGCFNNNGLFSFFLLNVLQQAFILEKRNILFNRIRVLIFLFLKVFRKLMSSIIIIDICSAIKIAADI